MMDKDYPLPRDPSVTLVPQFGSWQNENAPCLLEAEYTSQWARQGMWNMIPTTKSSKLKIVYFN